MRIIFLGSGNLATHLSLALKAAGEDILQIFSRTQEHAQALANKLNCASCVSISDIRTDADVYIFSVKDDALPSLISQLSQHLTPNSQHPLFLHTAGSVPMSVFPSNIQSPPRGLGGLCYGVLYPMQTFSKDRSVNFREIPCFVEASDSNTLVEIKALASKVSDHVVEMSSEKRRKLHLAAVFACNMVNHCYRLAEKVLEAEGIDFSLYLPLIQETANKVKELSPRKAQTGPMVRYDKNIMDAQISLINDERTRQIYRLMADSIHEDSTK
ncbi:MAG: DUF2520 domain-containing protein [Prevotella sp.]|nr:DUF2520 domain-containing protein [Prevotella sp.]